VVIGTVVGLGIDWALRRWTRVGEAPARLDNGREEPEVVVEHPASADGGTEAVDPPATEPTAAPVTSRQRSDPGR
jgi:hypothetical protein